MNKKPQRSWGEIQLAIAAITLTATLLFWNLFSVPQKQQVDAQSQDTTVPPAPLDPTQTDAPAPAPTQSYGFVPVKIIFGGVVPQDQLTAMPTTPVVAGVPQTAPQPKQRGGGGGGKPPIRTGSSHP